MERDPTVVCVFDAPEKAFRGTRENPASQTYTRAGSRSMQTRSFSRHNDGEKIWTPKAEKRFKDVAGISRHGLRLHERFAQVVQH